MIPSARADMYHSSVDPYQATFPPGPSPSFQGGPNIVAQRLNQSQMTATERALGLMRENELLRNSRKILSADNDRLKADLAQKVALLSRTDEAMTEAQSALQNVELANKRLTQKLADLERKHQQYLIETDRMLTSLKDELDDVLVSEINHGGN